MPALRALALVGFLGGTALLVTGIVRDDPGVAIAGIVLWTVGAALGLFTHRLFKAR